MTWNLLRRFAPAILLLGGFGGCTVLVLSPIFESAQGNARRATCQSSLKGIALMCQMYAEDNDSQYPPLSLEGKGWAEIIYRNSNRPQELSCPEGEPSKMPLSDYFYNARLAKIQTSKLKYPTSTIAFGDGMNNGPTNSHLLESPTYGFNHPGTFLMRHRGGANYAFVDGHIKWLFHQKMSAIANFDPAQKGNWP